MSPRVFLLSPAHCGGERARIVLREEARFDLAQRLRTREGAPLGEVFSFMSGLYFRGKLAYARSFARPPAGLPGVMVITPCQGLVSPDVRVGRPLLRRYGRIAVDPDEARYRRPLLRDARTLAVALKNLPAWEVVLLGSVASGKYVELLGDVFGERLVFPSDFVGRGDMSRGGLLLRCVTEKRELDYVPVLSASRHGPRPARLTPDRGILARTERWIHASDASSATPVR
ncbi:MAG TPA: hypothetical protein VIE44_17335 [Methylomirabilota bacterium]|jgi:hypothetical protein